MDLTTMRRLRSASMWGSLGGWILAVSNQVERDALNLLLFAATLQPAVFAAQHGASIPLLRKVRLSGELSAVFRLATEIARQAEPLKAVEIDLSTLTVILDEGAWKDRMDEHRLAVAQWQEGASSATMLFVGAGVVWQQWLGSRSILGELCELLKTDQPASTMKVREIVKRINDQGAVRRLVDETYRDAAGKRNRIEGKARSQLVKHLHEPLELAEQWLRIMAARPGGSGFLESTVANLRNAVEQRAPAATDAIKRVYQEEPALAA